MAPPKHNTEPANGSTHIVDGPIARCTESDRKVDITVKDCNKHGDIVYIPDDSVGRDEDEYACSDFKAAMKYARM